MKKKEKILKTIRTFQDEIRSKYKVKEIGIFGSVIRGEEKKTSDVDILVDFEDDADLFELVGLGLFLEEKLGQKVDVVPRRALRKEIKESVLNELVHV